MRRSLLAACQNSFDARVKQFQHYFAAADAVLYSGNIFVLFVRLRTRSLAVSEQPMDHEFVSYAIIIKYVSDIFLYYLKNPLNYPITAIGATLPTTFTTGTALNFQHKFGHS